MVRPQSALVLGLSAYVFGIVTTLAFVATMLAGGVSTPRWQLVTVGLLAAAVAASAVGPLSALLERASAVRDQLFAFVPFAATAIVVLVVAFAHSSAVLAPALVLLSVALGGWSVLHSGLRTRRADRLLGRADSLASLPDVDGRRPSRRLRALAAAFAAVSLAGAALGYALGEGSWYVYVAFAGGPLALVVVPERSVTVTDRGLRFESWAGRHALEWSALEGYYLGSDLVLLRSPAWRRDLTFDREAVDEEALAALERFLPRATSPGVPAGGLDAVRHGT
ncbi:hypothetical protein [Natronobiforma cellulositropha]|uniref:hypothetical protein n=1 Tax=Natronobiforma cellulositropha TaxID=1679076 RepID=UPI0021D60F26|nr:hypothetical protein [Natronobiforma cellulositropha]